MISISHIIGTKGGERGGEGVLLLGISRITREHARIKKNDRFK